ncbi:lysosomal acid glucosylceramidase [Drosophila grimshawi]|uniref:Glucosylceramidase n=1 Tax=Drosophila grimshawi TaxID=7222 RepID=B4JTN5_DROGR|nr:lysosomal acid glucosylceramidase [Drosophila grimshawi]EDV91464.1 GH17457 [Drosophila grimshawi]
MLKRKSIGLLGAFVLLIAIIGGQAKTVPCKLKDVKYGKVCVCTADYCDYLDNPTLSKDDDFAIISSSKQGLRFELNTGSFGSKDTYAIEDYVEPASKFAASNDTILSKLWDQAIDSIFSQSATPASSITRSVTLKLDRSKRFQKIEGFGGSFTGAVSYLLNNFKEQDIQDHLYKSYYAADGLGFNLLRISIGGCDFDLNPWAYNEEPQNEVVLTGMDKLHERDVLRVGQIKRMKEVSGETNLRIKGAAWSPPKWMKTNNEWTGFGQLKREYYQTWANYHLKWLDLMESNGLPIWAISTGNEPLNGIFFMFFVKFMSLGWTPQMQAVWLNDYLGPTIRNSKHKDIIIFGNDDQRFTSPLWFKMMNRTRPNSVDYIDGVALHWYWDEIFGNSFIHKTNKYMENKIQIISESCIGDKPWQKAAPLLGSWERGEKMARSMMSHLQDGFHGWIDWNIILDEEGGPNYVDNFVDAPVIADTITYTEFYKQPMFYVMGHFSKLVPEGSVHIEAVASNINLDCIAFIRPDNKIVAVLFNSGRADLDITIVDTIRGELKVNVPAKSIHTLYYN